MERKYWPWQCNCHRALLDHIYMSVDSRIQKQVSFQREAEARQLESETPGICP